MRNRLKELRALNAFAKKQSVGMQRKLMLYWVSMILVVFAAVIPVSYTHLHLKISTWRRKSVPLR